jgi:hypothetical protein
MAMTYDSQPTEQEVVIAYGVKLQFSFWFVWWIFHTIHDSCIKKQRSDILWTSVSLASFVVATELVLTVLLNESTKRPTATRYVHLIRRTWGCQKINTSSPISKSKHKTKSCSRISNYLEPFHGYPHLLPFLIFRTPWQTWTEVRISGFLCCCSV